MCGTAYKKTYFDPVVNRVRSRLCMPKDIILNENAISLETAPQVTHRIYLYRYEVKQQIALNIFCDISDEELDSVEPIYATTDMNNTSANIRDMLLPFLEIHCRYDLDGDGYDEPYIITMMESTQKIVRITARFDYDGIRINDKNEIICISPIDYFTDFQFIPSPDGKYHSMGYGTLLFSQNEAINTLFNQLLDAGTLSNMQSGFLGRGVRMRAGDTRFKPGEWKPLEGTAGVDLKNQIVPLPVRDPSPVLLQLLNLLIQTGKDTASINELMQGQAETQNSPGVTVMALLEQGLKVNSAIQRRLYRSLKKEFEKIYYNNKRYLTGEESIVDGGKFVSVASDLYRLKGIQIYPVADPVLSSDAQRIARAQALMEYRSEAGVNTAEVVREYFLALGFTDLDKIMPAEDPEAGPSIPIQKEMSIIAYNNAHAAYYEKRAVHDELRIAIADKNANANLVNMAGLMEKYKSDQALKVAEFIASYGILSLDEAMRQVTQIQNTIQTPSQQVLETNPDNIGVPQDGTNPQAGMAAPPSDGSIPPGAAPPTM
jgi:chaperonin GroES